MLIKIIQVAIKIGSRYASKYAYPVSRGLANIEKPAFNYAYRGVRMSRLKNPIYKGYKAGTVIGLAGDAILDALPESNISETGKDGKTRNNLVKFRRKRQFNQNCRPRQYKRYRTNYR